MTVDMGAHEIHRPNFLENPLIREYSVDILRKIGFNINEHNTADVALARGMAYHVLDHGSLFPLQPLQAPVEKPNEGSYWNETNLTYNNNVLDAVPVYSHGVVRFLRNQHMLSEFVDGNGIRLANLVSHENGDRVIRLLSKRLVEGLPNKIIVRYKGDEFFIFSDHREENLQKKVDEFIAEMKQSKDTAGFFSRNGAVHLEPVSVKRTDSQPTLIEDNPREPKRSLEERRQRILKDHKEQMELIENIATRPEEDQDRLLTLMEYSLFDPVLQGVAEEYSAKSNVDVTNYKDMRDLVEHTQRQDVDMIKVDFTSLLKSLNDDKERAGFNAGDAFLTETYRQILEVITSYYGEQSQAGRAQVTTFRRWGDFFMMVDKKDRKAIQKKLDAYFEDPKYLRVRKVDAKNNGFDASLYEESDKKEGDIVIPLDAIVVGTPVDYTSVPSDERLAINMRTASKSVDYLDHEVYKQRPIKYVDRVRSLIQNGTGLSRVHLLHIFNHTMNPFTNRGHVIFMGVAERAYAQDPGGAPNAEMDIKKSGYYEEQDYREGSEIKRKYRVKDIEGLIKFYRTLLSV